MSKVIWKRDKVIYKLDENENPFVNNFFTFYKNNILLNERFIIRVIDEAQIEIYGNFSENIVLKVNNVNYNFSLDEEKNAPAKNINEVTELDLDTFILDNKFSIESSEEQIRIDNLLNRLTLRLGPSGLSLSDENLLDIKVEQYTNEIYPDFPYKKYKLKIKDKTHIDRETNVIYVITILGKKIIIKEEPRYYWSNIKDLREFLKDTDLVFNEKTNERLKKMIQEKSVYLKRRFGLDKKQIEDKIDKLNKKYSDITKWYDRVGSCRSYFIVDINDGSINQATEDFMYIDNERYKLGNYFKSVDEAKKFLEDFKEFSLKWRIKNNKK